MKLSKCENYFMTIFYDIQLFKIVNVIITNFFNFLYIFTKLHIATVTRKIRSISQKLECIFIK